MTATVNKTAWAARLKKEVAEDILPFWARYAVDRENGGFYGKIDCDLNIDAGRGNQCPHLMDLLRRMPADRRKVPRHGGPRLELYRR